jgi:hypothetical protein
MGPVESGDRQSNDKKQGEGVVLKGTCGRCGERFAMGKGRHGREGYLDCCKRTLEADAGGKGRYGLTLVAA